MERTERIAALGPLRARILDCLGGNSRWAPGFFDPAPAADVFGAFRGYVHGLAGRLGTAPDPTTLSLLAAARLLTGELAAAREIVERLPRTPPRLDHGAGHCLTAAPEVLRAVLPLPPELSDSRRWLAGSHEQATLTRWLSEHEKGLSWRERDAVYVWSGEPAAG